MFVTSMTMLVTGKQSKQEVIVVQQTTQQGFSSHDLVILTT
jgi:hypothetical protein